MTVPVPDQLEFVSDGDGVTRDFPYPRRFLQADEVVVTLRDADGVETPQYLGQHYTIAGNSWQTGGTVSFINAPQVPNKVVRYRMTQAKQTVDLENKQRNDAKAVEVQLDRLTMAIQDRGSLLTRLWDWLSSTAAGLKIERAERIAGDAALNGRVNKEIIDRENGDKAVASLIGQAGSIEVLIYDTRLAVTFAKIKPTINMIRTGGYTLPGDGGDALYKRVASEPPAGKVKSDDGAWWEIAELLPNIRQFGARQDGITDDTDAIAACINYSECTFIPRGISVLKRQIITNGPKRMIGEGMMQSELRWVGAETSGIIIDCKGSWKTSSVENVGLKTDAVDQGTALVFDYSSLVNSSRTSFPRARYHAQVKSVYTEGVGLYNVAGWKSGVDFISCLGVLVTGCRMLGYSPNTNTISLGAGISFGGEGKPTQLFVNFNLISGFAYGCDVADSEGIYIHNNEFVTVGMGYRSRSALDPNGEPLLSFTGNHVAGINGCIDLEKVDQAEVSGNYFYPVPTQVGDFPATRIGPGCRSVIIGGNNFVRPNTTTLMRCVVEEGGSRTIIKGNVFAPGSSAGCIGIDITSSAANTLVERNVWRNVSTRMRNASTTAYFSEFTGFSGDLNTLLVGSEMTVQNHMCAA